MATPITITISHSFRPSISFEISLTKAVGILAIVYLVMSMLTNCSFAYLWLVTLIFIGKVAVYMLGAYFVLVFVGKLRRIFALEVKLVPPTDHESSRIGASCNDEQSTSSGFKQSTCGICKEDFRDEEADSCRILPACNHTFHTKCINPWLASHITCPICRRAACSTTADDWC